MSTYRLTPAAQHDLSSIWDFAEKRWDGRQAETYITEIGSAIQRVAADAERGRACDEVREGYRRYATCSHLIFFVERGGSMDVIRILYQRMDPSRHL